MYSNPRYSNEKGGILLSKSDGVDLYVDKGSLWERAIAGEFGKIAPYVPPPEPTPEEILAAERAAMICSRAQGKLAIGPEVWAQVVAMADDPETPWGLKVAIYDTYEWRRLDQNMDVLIWAMDLTPEQADDLFRLAMTL